MSDSTRYEVSLKAVREAPPMFSGRLSGIRFDPSATSPHFDGAMLEDVDFSNLSLEGYDAKGSVFERCDFTRAVFTEASLSLPPPSIYHDCIFDRADLRQCRPGLARFERCSFDHARIDGWPSWHAEFVDCTFSGRLRGIEFSGGMNPTEYRLPGATRHPNEFRGNDFSGARLIDVEFTGGIDLGAQKLPTGPEYHRFDIRPETVARVEASIPSLPADEQERARHLLKWLRVRYAGQDEVFTDYLGVPEIGFGLYGDLVARLADPQA